MKTKTFKIGEYCKGGIITVEIKGRSIAVIGKEWDYAKGSRRSSDQSGAKEWTRGVFSADDEKVERQLDQFINDLTTSYYTGQIIDYIKKSVKIATSLFW